MSKQQRMVTLALIAGFLVGFLFAWGVFGGDPAIMEEGEMATSSIEALEDKKTTEIENDISFDNPPTLVAESNVVHVKDQQAGTEVFLSRIEFTQDGWVAIREVTDSELGNILGAKRFDVGVHQATVMLLRETLPGNMYQVVLYADNGDKAFDFTTDPLLTNRDGQPISMSFEAY